MNPQLFLVWASPLAAALPRAWAEGLADSAGRLVSRLATRNALQVQANLAQAVEVPLAKDSVSGVFQTYARYYVAMMRLAHLSIKRAVGQLEITGAEHIQSTLQRGQGAVILSAHVGHWDLVGIALARHFGTCAAFVERLEPTSLFEFYSRTRVRHGLRPIEAGAGSRAPFEVLGANGLLAIASDRAFGSRCQNVPYGAGELSVPTSGIRLGLKIKSGIHLVLAFRTAKGYRVVCGQDLVQSVSAESGRSAEEQIARRYATELRDFVGQHPDQWCMMYPLASGTRSRKSSDTSGSMGWSRV